MGEAIAGRTASTVSRSDRVDNYILDGADRDLRRRLSISQGSAEMARSAFRGVGVQESHSQSLSTHRARAVAASLGLTNVEVFEGASTVAAARDRATQLGVATERQIGDLILRLRGAKDDVREWVSSPFFLDVTLRRP
jgi:hypothetical protein